MSTLGSGSLSSVRVIHLAAQNLYWFEVDSDSPSLRGESAAYPLAEPRSKTALPAWALSNKPLFPSALISRQSTPIDDGWGKKGGDLREASEMADCLGQKAKHWQQRY